MTAALGLAAALVAGVGIRRAALLATTLVFPFPILALAAISYLVARDGAVSRTAIFCDSVAAELRSGSSLRGALDSALVSVRGPDLPKLPHGSGSLSEAASVVAAEFTDAGRELGMTIEAAALAGGASADLFDEIAAVAIAQSEIAHEVRIASAPARVTALIFLAAPVIYFASRARSDSFLGLLDSPAQRLVGVLGLGLFALGLGAAGLILRRAR